MTIATTFSVNTWLPYQLDMIVISYGNRDHALLILDSVEVLALCQLVCQPHHLRAHVETFPHLTHPGEMKLC